MKKSYFLVFMMLPLLFLSGCSDYPSEGFIDTRTIREKANIEEISGSVYGISKDSEAGLKNLMTDIATLRNVYGDLWSPIREQGPEAVLPEFKLVYGGVDSTSVTNAYDGMVSVAKEYYQAEMNEYEGKVEALKKDISEKESVLANLKDKQQQYQNAIKPAETTYSTANDALSKGKEAYNAVFTSAVDAVTKIAESHGIKGTYSDNMIGRYRSIDYSNRNQVPQACPPQRGYFAVDVRDINKQCVYLSVPRNIQGTAAEADVKEILAGKFREFLKAADTLGEKGGWGRNATGLFAELDAAEETLKAAKYKAAQEFGSPNRHSYAINRAETQVNRSKSELERMQSEDYLKNHAISSYFDAPQEFREAAGNYLDKIRDHALANHIKKLSDITQEDRDGVTVGVFKEIDSGYTKLIALTDVLASSRYDKDVVRAIDILSTEEPAVADSDILAFEIEKDNIDRRGRDTSEIKMKKDALDAILKEYKKG